MRSDCSSNEALSRDVVRGLAHEIAKNRWAAFRWWRNQLESELDSAELKEYTHIIIQRPIACRNWSTGCSGRIDRPSLSR